MTPTPIPGTESWPERYGVVGSVAVIALVALVCAIRIWIKDRDFERDRMAKERELERERSAKQEAESDRIIAALNEKVVELMREHNREAMQLVRVSQAENDQRIQGLLQRQMEDNQRNAITMQGMTSTVAEALKVLTRKIKPGPD